MTLSELLDQLFADNSVTLCVTTKQYISLRTALTSHLTKERRVPPGFHLHCTYNAKSYTAIFAFIRNQLDLGSYPADAPEALW